MQQLDRKGLGTWVLAIFALTWTTSMTRSTTLTSTLVTTTMTALMTTTTKGVTTRRSSTSSTARTNERKKEDEEDETDVAVAPLTEQIMEPNIKMSDVPDVDELTGLPEPDWDRNKAVRDVAYYTRNHKFQDYDRRYYLRAEDAPSRLYEKFPTPPLRSLHWEVHKHCDVSFAECLKYAEKTVQLTALRREVDTASIVNQEKWSPSDNEEQIQAVQEDCLAALRRDNLTATPFQGPLDRFQWRTSVSYYMCWYTMLGEPDLAAFGEPCDNHANCLGSHGSRNEDPRADDSKPFACALYSFCPDHCCPSEHVSDLEDCFRSKRNPCPGHAGDKTCGLNRSENQHFPSLMANRMNLSCECGQSGYEWSSRFGLCVDVNECIRKTHNCSPEDKLTCVNLPGRFDCVCRFGFVYKPDSKRCVVSRKIENLLRESQQSHKKSTQKTGLIGSIINVLNKSIAPANYSATRLAVIITFYLSVDC